jgi:hypothetical protein
MIWAGLLLVAGGFAWQWYCHWLRHRPHNLERGTQHLAMAGSCGCVAAMLAGMGLIAVAIRNMRRERERPG